MTDVEQKDMRPFHFKQFSLNHHRSTMKVGSDAIFLGIWTKVQDTDKVLDVGCGSGIISMLIASRSKAKVDAIDIDAESVAEAKDNFENSEFSNRLKANESNFNNWKPESSAVYDLIISNPPFFTSDLHSSNPRKINARHAITLKYDELCSVSRRLLKKDGRLNVVIPYFKADDFIKTAAKNNLFLSRRLLIFPRRGVSPNRVNLEFCLQNMQNVINEYFIIREENNNFTAQYHEYLNDYYINIPKQ